MLLVLFPTGMLSAHEETDHEGRFTVDKQDRVRKAHCMSFSFSKIAFRYTSVNF